ncbi:carbohydrate ABC transporter permease [Bacillus sp. FJAT-50079]|uniref:carbohydrate ABC transporter permease n=1 Tax=Bacillus sp. FJAT-50079 TaxID=2833577 RepID=UPI001BC8D512|nr:carbohydrate ABC transporter permease [Bacillus sp. FJAT-50079]MBS4206685.1 carbohydrate ABC transporter permease [Bacillus sp. FJAT-50079]
MQSVTSVSTNKVNRKIIDIVVYSLLILTTIVCLFPVVWMIAISLKPVSESVGGFKAIALQNPTLDNFVAVYELIPILKHTYNSLFTTLIGTAFTLFFCALAGYAFAKFKFPARNVLFYIVIATMLVPLEVGVIPLFVIMKKFALVNSLWALIIPKAATAIGIFYMRQYIAAVPDEILEAAKIDGCTDFQTFWRVVLPIIKPGLAAWATLTLIARWNDFFWPLIFLRTQEKFTLMVSISLLPVSEGLSTPWPVIMAGTTFAVVPIIILYFIFQKYQVEGISAGAVKG